MKEKIKFKDLSGWLKVAVVGGIIYVIDLTLVTLVF